MICFPNCPCSFHSPLCFQFFEAWGFGRVKETSARRTEKLGTNGIVPAFSLPHSLRGAVRTGGDDPEKAADLVAALMNDDAADVNGRFLWIKDGLQSPIPSWGEADQTQPWCK
jgi:hypothetical protein